MKKKSKLQQMRDSKAQKSRIDKESSQFYDMQPLFVAPTKVEDTQLGVSEMLEDPNQA